MGKDNTLLYIQTEIKFANEFITDLHKIVFTALIDKEEKLKQLLRIDFEKEDLLNFILSQNIPSKRTEILSSIEIYLKEKKGVIFEFNTQQETVRSY